ncbi:MAG: right-handed parallel beta-helix repeat-containing protein [Acidimicrobiales bacterium]
MMVVLLGAVILASCGSSPTASKHQRHPLHLAPADSPATFLLPIPAIPHTRRTRVVDLRHATCRPAGSTGWGAALIARSHQRITGSIDAAGCQVAVYVPPGSSNVVLDHLVITNASQPAVLAQDASHIAVMNSWISVRAPTSIISLGSAPPRKSNPAQSPPEDKTITLVGTSHSLVEGNVLAGQWNGGISLTDDGPIDPAAFQPGSRHASVGNAVVGNQLSGGGNKGCGIIVAAYNRGEGVIRNLVAGNILRNVKPGGIVIAADPPGTAAIDNVVQSNVISQNQLPGVIVHSNSTGQTVSGTVIAGNTIDDTGTAAQFMRFLGILGGHSAGIAILGIVAPPKNTLVENNFIKGEFYGIYQANGTATKLAHNSITGIAPGGTSFLSLPTMPPGASGHYQGPTLPGP